VIYSSDDLQMMLERVGGAVHTVDGAELFCRVKSLEIKPDEFGRAMIEHGELEHIAGATFSRRAHHSTVIDGTTWDVVAVRQKLSGNVVWSLEREVG
jgi:L-fucose isomerase-like protein